MTYTRKDTQTPAPEVRKPTMPQVRPRLAGLSRSAVALFRLGTYRARIAAALMIVAGGLLYQTGAEALEQSSKKVLYLDAPSVSVPQAQNAGETARGYAGPDSNVDDAVLAWVDVKPVPLEARKAFASITVPSGQPPGGVSYDDAVNAGDAMVAQLGGDSPAGDESDDDELASADPVRPKLGDVTKAADDPAPEGADQQSRATGSGSQQPEAAATDSPTPSDLGLPAPMAEEYAPEPSTDSPTGQPPDSGGELASVSEDVPEYAEEGTGGNSVTGPISDDYAPEAAAPEPSNESPVEDAPPSETEPGSSGTGKPNSQGDEAFPTIVVPDSPESGDESEQEYAGVTEGSETKPETSEPENIQDSPDESSSEPSTEPSPAEEASTGPDEQESEGHSNVVAVVPYEPGTEEGQESPEQSSQPPAEVQEESAGVPSSMPFSEEAESDSPESGQQEEMPEQAAATPAPPEDEPAEEETAQEEPAGEGPVVQPEAESTTEPGDDEVTQDMGTDEQLPEGVRIDSSDEAGVQKLSVAVHQESDATDNSGGNSPEAQEAPEESAPTDRSASEQASPASQENQNGSSNGRGGSNNPNAQRDPEPDTSGRPDSESADRPDPAPTSEPESSGGSGADRNDHSTKDNSPAPRSETGDEQEPSSTAPSEPSPTQSQDQLDPTSEPPSGGESRPQTTPGDSGRQGSQQADQQQVSEKEPPTSAPEPTPALKDRAPRQNAEGPGQGAQGNNQAQDPTRGRDEAQGRQQRLQPKQQQSFQPAREPRQAKHIATRQANRAVSQIPAQPVDTPAQSYTEPAAEQGWDPTPQPVTDAPAQDYSAEDTAAQPFEAMPEVGEVDSYVQEDVDPYAGDVAAEAAPAPTAEPATYDGDVDSTSYDDSAALPESYGEAAPAETYVEPVAQVPAQQLEPVQRVSAQELEPAPQVDNVLTNDAPTAQPSVAPAGTDSDSVSSVPAQQEVSSTVDTTVQQTVSAGGGE